MQTDRPKQTDTNRLKEMIFQSFFQCLVIVFLLIVDIFWHPDQCISHSSYTHIYLHVSPPPSFPNHLPFNFFLFTYPFVLPFIAFSLFFQKAKKLRIHRTVNNGRGGEGTSWNVKEAINDLYAERIGHGYNVLKVRACVSVSLS